MWTPGPLEIIIILVIVLIVFGPKRLPDLGRSAGALEGIVKRLLTGPTWPPSSSPAELKTLVKAVDRTARSETRQARPPAPGAE